MKIFFYSVCFITLFNSFSQVSLGVLEKDDLQAFIANEQAYTTNQEAFFQSVKSNAEKITKHLLSKKIDVNEYNEVGSTALITAVTNGNLALVDLLIENGADVNKHQETGLQATALMYAGYSNKEEIVNTLIENGANIDDVDINNDPAINWASYYGNIEAMKAMINNGASLNIKSKHGLPVDVVYRLWHADSVAQVFRNSSFGNELEKKEQFLVDAVREGNYAKAEKLLKKGVSANMLDGLESPLIHVTAEKGDVQMLKLLTDNGADLSIMNRVGQSAVTIAARFGHVDIVDFLIEKGVSPNLAGDEYNLTPLIGTAVNGSIEIADILIKAGADLDVLDVVNQSPAMFWAMMYGNEDFVLHLIENGADYQKKYYQGKYDTKSLAGFYEFPNVINKINQLENPLLGSWLVEEIHYIYPDTTYKAKMQMAGRFMVSDETYSIMYNPYGNIRKSPEDMSKMSQEEKLYSFQTVVFNSGSYELVGDDIVTTADIAKVAGFEGGIQYYKIENSEDGMTITMYDETYPSGKKPEWFGKMSTKIFLKKED
ncbi:MAG: ankyrin repeat domain-containing protein [Ekhidna sp.]